MVGRTFAHYEILAELGGGGMGTVYRARDTRLGRDAALKVFTPERGVTPGGARRFLREAQTAASLRHPNICTIYDAGEVDGVFFISMAYIPGRSLRTLLDDGPFAPDRALDIAIQVSRGLEAAHERDVIHRDVKPANIMVDDTGQATILDFGIAKLAGHATAGDEVRAMGTVAYMSPEQANGEAVDHRTDIWSLGVCLYEMLSGVRPFVGEHDSAVIYQIVNRDPVPLERLGKGLPRRLSRVVARAMEKDPRQRQADAGELLAELVRCRSQLREEDREPVPSVAVLPFANLSTEPEQRYFCEGMAEEVINSLAQVQGLRVASRTSSFAFRDGEHDIAEIGRRLGVDAVLEGSVQKSGQRLRITAQLIDVGDGYHLWSQRYDRDLEDVFAIQDEIACSIVRSLEVTLTEREKRVIEHIPTRDLKAYDYYMRGLHRYHEMDRKGLEASRSMFTSAIVRDPGYALAYCGLADAYSMLVTFYENDPDFVEGAITAGERAVELAPDLGVAHASYGLALSISGRFEEAEREFVAAVDRSPKLFEAFYFRARACRAQGKLAEAAVLFERASDLRPEDYQAPILAADTYRGLNNPDAMRRAFEKGLRVAAEHAALHPGEARVWYLGAHAHYELGDMDSALEWCERALAIGGDDPATLYNTACLFALVGDVDRCFDCLERAADNGFSNVRWLTHDPDLAAIRDDERYTQLVQRIEDSHATA